MFFISHFPALIDRTYSPLRNWKGPVSSFSKATHPKYTLLLIYPVGTYTQFYSLTVLVTSGPCNRPWWRVLRPQSLQNDPDISTLNLLTCFTIFVCQLLFWGPWAASRLTGLSCSLFLLVSSDHPWYLLGSPMVLWICSLCGEPSLHDKPLHCIVNHSLYGEPLTVWWTSHCVVYPPHYMMNSSHGEPPHCVVKPSRWYKLSSWELWVTFYLFSTTIVLSSDQLASLSLTFPVSSLYF